jgi:hypothetical protein
MPIKDEVKFRTIEGSTSWAMDPGVMTLNARVLGCGKIQPMQMNGHIDSSTRRVYILKSCAVFRW